MNSVAGRPTCPTEIFIVGLQVPKSSPAMEVVWPAESVPATAVDAAALDEEFEAVPTTAVLFELTVAEVLVEDASCIIDA